MTTRYPKPGPHTKTIHSIGYLMLTIEQMEPNTAKRMLLELEGVYQSEQRRNEIARQVLTDGKTPVIDEAYGFCIAIRDLLRQRSDEGPYKVEEPEPEPEPTPTPTPEHLEALEYAPDGVRNDPDLAIEWMKHSLKASELKAVLEDKELRRIGRYGENMPTPSELESEGKEGADGNEQA